MYIAADIIDHDLDGFDHVLLTGTTGVGQLEQSELELVLRLHVAGDQDLVRVLNLIHQRFWSNEHTHEIVMPVLVSNEVKDELPNVFAEIAAGKVASNQGLALEDSFECGLLDNCGLAHVLGQAVDLDVATPIISLFAILTGHDSFHLGTFDLIFVHELASLPLNLEAHGLHVVALCLVLGNNPLQLVIIDPVDMMSIGGVRDSIANRKVFPFLLFFMCKEATINVASLHDQLPEFLYDELALIPF